MNERIKELLSQAGGEFYEGFAGSTNFVKFAENDFEKFAELIVRECAQHVLNDTDRHRKEYFADLVKTTFWDK